jgi:hypothetical protein
MTRALVDTDILSEVLKGRDESVARMAADYLARHGELPVVTGNTPHFEAVAKAGYPVTTENWRRAT